jgi:hypothetical protein
MERTLDIMMKELERVKEERKPLYEAVNVLDKEIAKLKDEITRYKLDNGLYHPMSELANYKGREIYHIVLVERDEDGALDIEYMYNDEMFSVDKRGYLDYSSYNCGVMRYDENIGKYVEWCHYRRTEHDYVGFLEIELEDDDED